MKGSFYLLGLGFLYICTGILVSSLDYDLTEKNKNRGAVKHGEFYDYSGVLNVHSKKSSGSSSVQSIIADANEAGLDFLIFNEESVLNLKQPEPIKYGNLSVFYGLEFNYNGSNLLYTTSEKQKTFLSHSESKIFISNYLENNGPGFFVLAHPEKRGYEWTSNRPAYLDGVEVVNLRELWRESWRNRKFYFLSSVFFYPFNPEFFFLNVYSDEAISTKFWDKWSIKRKTSGYIGSDATSKLRIYKDNFIDFPGYKSIFMMARNHIVLRRELLGVGAEKKILTALKKGQSYFSIDIFGNPKGFNFYAQSKNKKYLMGEEVALKEVKSLKVTLPKIKEVVKVFLYKDGELIEKGRNLVNFEIEARGVYRVEVRVKPFFPLVRSERWLPWVFSNPVYVK